MPTITVVTAVLAGKHGYLRDTYESLERQQLPSGWDWQWVIQEDGETGIPEYFLSATDARISWGTGAPGRAATARTLALGRVDGVLVRALDADDILPESALRRDIEALVSNPEVSWCVSPAVDLLPDGSFRPGPRDPDPGRLPAEFLAGGERAGVLQVVGTTMCAYAELVRALGGWQALPTEEDVALLLAAEAVSDGWMLAEPGLIYRRWSGNTSEEVDKRSSSAANPRRDVLLARVSALRATGWRWSPSFELRHAGQEVTHPVTETSSLSPLAR